MRHLSGVYRKDTDGWLLPIRLDVLEKLEEYGGVLDRSAREKQNELQNMHDEMMASKLRGDAAAVMPIKTKPFDHQRVAYQIGTRLDAAALFMEQGCGKTLAAIAIAGERLSHGVQFLLVVCPASVVPVWPKEFAEHADYPHRVIPLIADNSTKKIQLAFEARETATPGELTVVVVNFESAWRIESALEPLIKKQMIVIDESQRIKTPGTEQSKCMHRLGKLAKYRYLLSGTPITQNPLDLYSQYKFLEPSMFGQSFTVFRNKYAIMGGFEGKQVIGYKNLEHLMQKAHSIAYRVTKTDALDLPDEVTSIRPVLLPDKIVKMYRELKRESILELTREEEKTQIVAANVLTKLLRLQQLAGGNLSDENGQQLRIHDAKLSALKDELITLLSDQERKVVIFARFLPEIRQITGLLETMRIDHRVITGAIGQADRGQYVEEFQTIDGVRVFLAQIATAGLGITLTAADTAIFYSMDFSLANHEQAKARIHRIGQRRPVTYMYLLADGTVDEQIFDALKNKKSIADHVVDNWRDILHVPRG